MSVSDVTLRSELGRIASLQSFGTVDGPGIRYVVFMQGCPLRCACCHNPETWSFDGGEEKTAGEVFDTLLRYRSYFGREGGVTVSGGEPLMQAAFVRALFTLCRDAGIHTCLDTSGCSLNAQIEELLDVTDLVLLDLKYASEAQYQRYVGCSLAAPLAFLDRLEARGIPAWIRQVLIRGKNDSEQDLKQSAQLLDGRSNIQRIELLPFRRLCLEKYKNLGIDFPFAEIDDTTEEEIARAYTFFER